MQNPESARCSYPSRSIGSARYFPRRRRSRALHRSTLNGVGGEPIQAAVPIQEILGALDARGDVLACAYLFGSAARGDAGPLSDLDLGVLFVPTVDLDKRVEFAAGLVSDLQHIDGPRIDVTILNDAPPSVAHHVVCSGRLLLTVDERERVRFETRAIREYLDLEPLLAHYDRIMVARLKERRLDP